MEASHQKRKGILDKLIDKDGLKTEVTVSLTNQTLSRTIIALLVAGMSVMAIHLMIRQFFPNPQLVEINKKLEQLKIPKNKFQITK